MCGHRCVFIFIYSHLNAARTIRVIHQYIVWIQGQLLKLVVWQSKNKHKTDTLTKWVTTHQVFSTTSISWKQIIDHYYALFLIVKRFSGLNDRLRCLCVYVNSMWLSYMENWAQSFVKFSYLGSHQKILVKLDSID